MEFYGILLWKAVGNAVAPPNIRQGLETLHKHNHYNKSFNP
jgi:hypothetical protein